MDYTTEDVKSCLFALSSITNWFFTEYLKGSPPASLKGWIRDSDTEGNSKGVKWKTIAVMLFMAMAAIAAYFISAIEPVNHSDLPKTIGMDVRRLLSVVYTDKRTRAGVPSGVAEIRYRRGTDGGINEWRILSDGDTLTGEDVYQIRFFSTNAAYCYIFQVDSSGRIHWLYPKNPASPYSSGSNPLQAEQWITAPSDGGAFFLDDQQGIEHVYVVMTSTPWDKIERMLIDSTVVPSGSGNIQMAFNLKTRGVGGVIHAEPAATSAIAGRASHKMPLITGIDGILVLERWFRHQ